MFLFLVLHLLFILFSHYIVNLEYLLKVLSIIDFCYLIICDYKLKLFLQYVDLLLFKKFFQFMN